jgi:hypothetical protein
VGFDHSTTRRGHRFFFPCPNVVAVLQIQQVIAQTAKLLRIAVVPLLPQVLADQIKHGGEGAEVVVILDMELDACFVHSRSMAQAS